MKNKYVLLWLSLLFFLAGCSHSRSAAPSPPLNNKNLSEISKASEEVADREDKISASLEKERKDNINLEPIMPTYDPLEEHIVSFSMMDEKLQTVLYSLARSIGMNLIIDSDVDYEDQKLTMNFEKVTASQALKEILRSFDLYYETKGNIIRIRSFQEKLFKINFLDTEIKTTFDVGGDVLGSQGSESSTGLSGNFKLTGSGSKTSNPYETLEKIITQVKSKEGKYTINRMAGSLFIKDKPSVISSVSQIVNHFQNMLNRQVLIKARIIEVNLSDDYKYGIDWSVIRDSASSVDSFTKMSWSAGNGLVLSHRNGNYSLNPLDEAVNALQTFGDAKIISNPSIRSMHGKPAIISVGTSLTYKKSVETTTSGTGDVRTEETQVEVSNVFDGLILGIIPFIEENGKISLLINPIKSDVDRASLELQNVGADQSISLPEVNVKEISSTISMHDQDVIILGGLIDKRNINENQDVPYLSVIPVVGYLFKSEMQNVETRELVIILSVKII